MYADNDSMDSLAVYTEDDGNDVLVCSVVMLRKNETQRGRCCVGQMQSGRDNHLFPATEIGNC